MLILAHGSELSNPIVHLTLILMMGPRRELTLALCCQTMSGKGENWHSY